MRRVNVPAVLRGPLRRHAVALAIVLASSLAVHAFRQNGSSTTVPYPEGYRTWVHIKTGLVSAKHPDFTRSGGFRHIYANPEAVTGYRNNGVFPDGSIIVVDWLEGTDNNGAFTESTRRKLDVMVKDQTRFAATKGWGFETFKGDSRTERNVTAVQTQCVACHSGPGTRDLVFSKFRE